MIPLASHPHQSCRQLSPFAGPVHLTRRVDVQDHVCFYLQIDISDARRRPYILRKGQLSTCRNTIGWALVDVTRVAFSPPDDKYILSVRGTGRGDCTSSVEMSG